MRSRIVATFQPKRTDNLRPEAAGAIGWRGEWTYAWTMDEEDPYPGQVAYLPVNGPFWHWVPEEDLVDVVDS